MYLQPVLLLCSFIYLGSGQQLFKKLNRFKHLYGLYYWKMLTYDFDGVQYLNDTAIRWTPESIYFKEEYIEEKDFFFKQYNNVPYGFEGYATKIFITVPRKRYGIPSTLNYLEFESKTWNKLKYDINLKPYPDVESIPSLVSVYRVKVDSCHRLWLVDTGLLDIPDQPKQVKPPEIVIFNLKSNKELLRYQLKPSDLSNGNSSGLTSITVDVTNTTCDDAFAYINDLATGGLIVFSLRERDSWRFTHPTFNYDCGGSFDLRGRTIDWQEGICSIALTDPDASGIRKAYYHPFLSTQEFSITTEVLKDKNGDFDKQFKTAGIRGPLSQSGIHVYHRDSKVMFFANTARDGLMCWNVNKPLTPQNTALVVFDRTWLASITELRAYKHLIYIMSNSLDTFVYYTLNSNHINFRIYYSRITDLINNTVCQI